MGLARPSAAVRVVPEEGLWHAQGPRLFGGGHLDLQKGGGHLHFEWSGWGVDGARLIECICDGMEVKVRAIPRAHVEKPAGRRVWASQALVSVVATQGKQTECASTKAPNSSSFPRECLAVPTLVPEMAMGNGRMKSPGSAESLDRAGCAQSQITIVTRFSGKVLRSYSPALCEPQPSVTRLSLCAEAFRAIEADLEAFSPGRVAAVGVRGGLAEGERAF